ncbi:MAG: apolipoprotein N-acyltransferase [Spirochaetales bacterium]|nr:apolipoprotein N-acyltransferase [Spirochaetales bacterium]
MRIARAALATAGSALLLAFAHPNPLRENGAGFVVFFALAPAFMALRGVRARHGALLGALFGSAFHALSNYWLASWHPAALAFVTVWEALFFAALFASVSAARARFPRAWPLLVPLAWLACERLRSVGALAYPYGFPAYALYGFKPALGLAALGGIEAVSLAVGLANAALAAAAEAVPLARLPGAGRESRPVSSHQARAGASAAALIALGLLVAGGIFPAGGVEPGGSLKLALVQPALAGRQSGAADYDRAVDRLLALSAKAAESRPDLIVWHETAVVPAIDWHLRYRREPAVYKVVRKAADGVEALGIPVLLGTGRSESVGGDPSRRLSWNSARLSIPGLPPAHYDKTRLVPFAERFPAASVFPRLAARVERELGYFWQAGAGPDPLVLDGVPLATPICFEDSFPDLFARFAERGARAFILLTDDSWSRSASMSRQHLAMSVFRAAETGLAVARATADGISAVVGPDGAVLASLPRGVEGVLHAELPLALPGSARSGAAARGAWLGRAALAACALALFSALIVRLRTGRRRRGLRG